MNLEQKVENRIYNIRYELNITLKNLAEYSDIDISSIEKIERGDHSNIKINTLEKILDALQIYAKNFIDFEIVSTQNSFVKNLISKVKKLP